MAKEIKDLLKDKKIVLGMIIVPLLIFPLMGGAIGLSTQSVMEATKTTSFALMNLDQGNYSTMATSYFDSLPNVTVRVVQPQSVSDGMQAALKQNVSTLVVIPADFSAKVGARSQASIESYTTVTGFGVGQQVSSTSVPAILNSFGGALSAYYIRTGSAGLDPSVVLAPLALNESTYLNGKLLAASPTIVASAGLEQSFALPIATFIVLIFAMQIASTAMAVEKEQKTFETLLTLPVTRFQILGSKLIGSTVIAAMGAVTSIIGFTYYMSMVGTMTPSAGSVAVEITPPLTFYIMLGVLLFLTLALATSIAIIVSVFTSDVRGAQAVVGYLALPIILPTFLVIFGDFNTLALGLKAVVLAVPFSYVAVFAMTGIFGDLTYALIGVAYLVAWVVGTLYLASRLFNSERILTSRFTFGRKKPKQPVGDG